MDENPPTTCPAAIHHRADATKLWKHLLSRGISFHWEDAPSEWVDTAGQRVLSHTEAANVQRLFNEVAALNDERCYDDALSLLKRALKRGTESVH